MKVIWLINRSRAREQNSYIAECFLPKFGRYWALSAIWKKKQSFRRYKQIRRYQICDIVPSCYKFAPDREQGLYQIGSMNINLTKSNFFFLISYKDNSLAVIRDWNYKSDWFNQWPLKIDEVFSSLL
jgi:hypothetical protein